MKKHILIFFCFNNTEHIKKSFDSMTHEDIDYFIVENKSKNSDDIKKYFLEQKQVRNNIVGYIQFQKNIVANAMNIFLKNYMKLLEQYEYITITDGDYYIYDMNSTLKEILGAFNNSRCAISSVDIYPLSNWRCSNRIIGTDHYINIMKQRQNSTPNNIITSSGTLSLMTLQKKDLNLIKLPHFMDGYIRNKVIEASKLWYITVKNQCYHLTDECCYDATHGDEYMTWKRSINNIWYCMEDSNYFNLI